MATIFEVDAEGWRESNAGRPAAHLVRELIQNVFDEKATQLDVQVEWVATEGARILVVDDVEGGIRDPSLIFTIWKSDKQDSPTKRGRMGRGLKELIAVADHTLIVTQGGPALEFTRHRGGNWERTSPRKVRPEKGTRVTAEVGAWRKRDVDAVVGYLRQMRPPPGLTFTVNGQVVERVEASERHELRLPTVVFVDEGSGRAARERTAETAVELFAEPGAMAASWLYEMGIPVEEIDFPLSVDVGQRVPLREKRDTVTEAYRRELFAKLLNLRIGQLAPEQLRDSFVLTAAQGARHLTEETKRKVADAWTEGRAFASTSGDFQHATGQHIPAMQLRKLPQAVRDLVREVGTDVRQVMAERESAACVRVAEVNMTVAQEQLIRVFAWIAAGINRPCSMHIYDGRPGCSADFSRSSRTLRLFRENLGDAWFERPLGAAQLGLLIHELGHWSANEGDAHGMEFHSDVECVGGAIAAFLLRNAEAARRKSAWEA
jgi:hypothetical protein